MPPLLALYGRERKGGHLFLNGLDNLAVGYHLGEHRGHLLDSQTLKVGREGVKNFGGAECLITRERIGDSDEILFIFCRLFGVCGVRLIDELGELFVAICDYLGIVCHNGTDTSENVLLSGGVLVCHSVYLSFQNK